MLERESQILFEESLRSLTDEAISETKLELQCNSVQPMKFIDGLSICKVVGIQEGVPMLTFEFAGTSYTHKAIAVVGSVGDIEVGSYVCAAFDQNRCDRPLVLGKIACDIGKSPNSTKGTVLVDEEQFTLKCGKASINLKADGTVAIRGTNVTTRASNTNRIRGGNVQIN